MQRGLDGHENEVAEQKVAVEAVAIEGYLLSTLEPSVYDGMYLAC